jgi:hypothetical protein
MLIPSIGYSLLLCKGQTWPIELFRGKKKKKKKEKIREVK